jgi:hypothetical protein
MHWICSYSTVPLGAIGEPSDVTRGRFGSYKEFKGVQGKLFGFAAGSHLANRPSSPPRNQRS